MARRSLHYERAFEAFLRARRIPYVAVDEARKTLLPHAQPAPGPGAGAIKSFDFVLYGDGVNLLVDVKGRRIARAPPRPASGRTGRRAPLGPASAGRLESWVTRADVESLDRWERLFGPGFEAVFVFVYWWDAQPPDALFQEVMVHERRWYALRAIDLRSYARLMRPRSARWGTVHIPAGAFERASTPFAPPRPGAGGAGPGPPREPGHVLPALPTLDPDLGSFP